MNQTEAGDPLASAAYSLSWWPDGVPTSVVICGLVVPAVGAHLYGVVGRRHGGWIRILIAYYATLSGSWFVFFVDEKASGEAAIAGWPFGLVPGAGVLLGLAFALAGVRLWIAGRTDRHRQVLVCRCRRCRYDLTGNASGICPECATSCRPVKER